MYNLFVIFLSVVMFLDCVILICLVLLQLPKKDAGAGLAFGSGTTDALFGAGSGNVLTKITKYVAGAFFGLALVLAMLSAHMNSQSAGSAYIKALGQGSSGIIPTAPQTTPAQIPVGSAPKSTPSSGSTPFLQLSNAPIAPITTPAATNK